MAQLNSRGTMTRSRWDFFERSNGFAFVNGYVASGTLGAYFANNSRGSTNLDIYNVTWSASVSGTWQLSFLVPPLVLALINPVEYFIHPLLPDAAQPPGVIGTWTSSTGVYSTIVRYSGTSTGAVIAPIMGDYFLTLPPGWAIALGGITSAGPCELSMTVWYQEVVDNISPAR